MMEQKNIWIKKRIENIIEQVVNTCLPWIIESKGNVLYIDPLDQKEISAHYGVSHAAVALIIYGLEKNNQELVARGRELLESLLVRWNECKKLSGFHNDFNNFALCVLDSYFSEYHNCIMETVLNTEDSSHNTVNWLPMRWYVNLCRYQWTGDEKYKKICLLCYERIKEATYNDGYIDDRLPKGLSFNLQYDVATVAVMQFLRISGEKIDISKETGALLNAIFPDGDINYFGRGTNQIFAWGLWIFLLSSSGQSEVEQALIFLENKIPAMLKNNNIMLNNYLGEEKYMWWDYHYSSVYIAHFLFWLVLADKCFNKMLIEPKINCDGSSGIHIQKNESVFVVSFDGRTEYLSETGPTIVAAWTNKSGVIFKGSFGPWQGPFGNKYIQRGATLWNFVGITRTREEKDLTKCRFIHKLMPKLSPTPKITIKPDFVKPEIKIGEYIDILYSLNNKEVQLNVLGIKDNMSVYVDGIEKSLTDSLKIRNQYDWVNVNHIDIRNASRVELIMR